jgi:hypothetical protein
MAVFRFQAFFEYNEFERCKRAGGKRDEITQGRTVN